MFKLHCAEFVFTFICWRGRVSELTLNLSLTLGCTCRTYDITVWCRNWEHPGHKHWEWTFQGSRRHLVSDTFANSYILYFSVREDNVENPYQNLFYIKTWWELLEQRSGVWGDVPTTPGAAGHRWAPAPECREVGSTAPSGGRAAASGSSAQWSSDRDIINRGSTHTHTHTKTSTLIMNIFHSTFQRQRRKLLAVRKFRKQQKGKSSPHMLYLYDWIFHLRDSGYYFLPTGVTVSSYRHSKKPKQEDGMCPYEDVPTSHILKLLLEQNIHSWKFLCHNFAEENPKL